MPLTVNLYRRPGCSLCDDAAEWLDAAIATEPRTIVVDPIDISTDPRLEARYGARIPVLAIGADEIDLVTSSGPIRRLLERARSAPAAG